MVLFCFLKYFLISKITCLYIFSPQTLPLGYELQVSKLYFHSLLGLEQGLAVLGAQETSGGGAASALPGLPFASAAPWTHPATTLPRRTTTLCRTRAGRGARSEASPCPPRPPCGTPVPVAAAASQETSRRTLSGVSSVFWGHSSIEGTERKPWGAGRMRGGHAFGYPQGHPPGGRWVGAVWVYLLLLCLLSPQGPLPGCGPDI